MVRRHARVSDSIMDTGLMIGLALLLTALTLRSGAMGNPIPGYILSLIAGAYAIYAINNDDPRSQIMLAWAICASGILSAYVGQQLRKI
jgi:hypothetical protein